MSYISATQMRLIASAINTSKADVRSLAPAYDNTKAYKVGILLSYQGKLYKCITNTNAGTLPTNAFYFREVSIADVVTEFETGKRIAPECCYTLGTFNPNIFTINDLIASIAEHFDELMNSQRVRIYLFDDTDLMNQVRDTKEFLITKKRTVTNDGSTSYVCTLYYDDYTIYKINLWLEGGAYQHSYTEEKSPLKRDIDNIQASITGALTEDY